MKILTNLWLPILAVLAVSVSCSKKQQLTLSGFEFDLINDAPGEVVKEGDYLYFRYHIKDGDSTLYSSVREMDVIRFKLPKVEKQPLEKAQPIFEALSLMSPGDSAIVYQMLTEDMKKGFNLPNTEKIALHVSLIDKKDDAGFQQDMEIEKRAAAERAEAIKGEANEVIKKANEVLAQYKAGKLDASLTKTESGLKYIVHEMGTGPKAESGRSVSVHYYGMLTDGTRFDDSWSRGSEFLFNLGRGEVIPGWDEGVSYLPEGSKATLFVPAALAYGAEGAPPTIPANAELVFYIEVRKVLQ
ncbi:MAG: FKBP-type peptidyl-prolyl cis-trans isomerase [Saprospiraceae bacterium]|jgi:FKBP-type peptidyl-prolyl cis-trans isomerase FkpA|nr:FKBP-type peptidyl-prolyl cis-trans isomerase [Saprospiraceae bacterium]MBP9210850.1 FKBP-type peptidyl-prolyl cis-trans isomerase [Saprospiraceae bacterium]MBV6471774.1 hypothetical protein [Saprospiraceae bacterium]